MGTARKDSGDVVAGRAQLLRAAGGPSAGFRSLTHQQPQRKLSPARGHAPGAKTTLATPPWGTAARRVPKHQQPWHSTQAHRDQLPPPRADIKTAAERSKPAENHGLQAPPPHPRCQNSPHPGTSGVVLSALLLEGAGGLRTGFCDTRSRGETHEPVRTARIGDIFPPREQLCSADPATPKHRDTEQLRAPRAPLRSVF